nr:unnamed protein product [Spirometra erinaceieuropaei]
MPCLRYLLFFEKKTDKKTQPASVISPKETSQQHVSPVTPPQVAPVSATPAVPPSQSVSSSGDVEPAHSKQPRRKTTSLRAAETPGGSGVVQHSQVDHTKPDAAATVKAPPSQKTLLTYAQELEFLVVEALGLETLVSTRTRFTELALPDLSAVSAAPTALSATQLPPDVIQLRAHLRAKEAECQVSLYSASSILLFCSDATTIAVSRRHPHPRLLPLTPLSLSSSSSSSSSSSFPPSSSSPPSPTTATTVSAVFFSSAPQPVKVTCASKSVQSEPVPQETASSRPSDIVIMTLQEEIGRLAKESTLMSQRNANLEKRLSNMQSEMHRATAKATRTAEASAAERIEKSEARVKQLQVELNEKNQLLASQRSQLEQAEEVNLKSNQELQRVLREYENLRKADADLKEELAGVSSQVQELQQQLVAKEMERESAVRKERLSAQALTEAREQVEHLEASLKAEGLSSATLKQRIDQLMSDTEKDRGLTQQLEEDLADSKRELSARQESLAKAEEQASSAQRELLSVRQELDQAHTECDSLRSKLASAQQELDAAQKALASTTATVAATVNEAAAAADVEEVVVPQSVAPTSSSSSAEPQEASSTALSEEESCTSCSALASEVEHYKNVLDSTENVLSKLQTTVAQEEGRWRKSLQDVTSENASIFLPSGD